MMDVPGGWCWWPSSSSTCERGDTKRPRRFLRAQSGSVRLHLGWGCCWHGPGGPWHRLSQEAKPLCGHRKEPEPSPMPKGEGALGSGAGPEDAELRCQLLAPRGQGWHCQRNLGRIRSTSQCTSTQPDSLWSLGKSQPVDPAGHRGAAELKQELEVGVGSTERVPGYS